MIGILYFSSTGNSLYIAKRVRESLGGKICYIPKYQGDGSEFDKLIIVTPIHSYGLPKLVYELLPKLDKSKELIIIQNYGGMVGGADYWAMEYCKKCGLNIVGIFTIKMPENFTVTFTVPKFYIKSTLKKADSAIERVIQNIKKGIMPLPKKKRTKEAKYLKNMGNWHIIGKRFKVSQECVKCGKCVKVCPVGNITFENGEIVFGDKCVACLACYHRCPQKAIKYLSHKKKDRYLNPHIDENDLGKDFN